MSTPSSSIEVENGGIDPGVVPPTSAWWPREATKKLGPRDPGAAESMNTGVTTVMSGKWVPP